MSIMGTRRRRKMSHLVVLYFVWFVHVILVSSEGDTLNPGVELSRSDFLESKNKRFRLRIFSLQNFGNSNLYLGIEYIYKMEGDMKIVWVANRDRPFTADSYFFLKIGADGNLALDGSDDTTTPFIINSESPAPSSNTSAKLFDTGNFVLKAGDNILWQSFDHPTDTLLLGMKLGLTLDAKRTKPRKHFLTSWVSPGVPASGAFTLGLDPNNTKQLVVLRRENLYWHSGNWNGRNFTYFPDMYDDESFNFTYISNGNESYFVFNVPVNITSAWMEMNSSGTINMFMEYNGGWTLWYLPTCDVNESYRTKACIDQKPFKCSSSDEFLPTTGNMDSWDYLRNRSLGPNDCEVICRNNCSCKAYASAKSDGTGCKFSSGLKQDIPDTWFAESFHFRNSSLTEKKRIDKGTVIDRNATETQKGSNKAKKKRIWERIVAPLISLAVLAVICSLCYLKLKDFCFGEKKGSHRKNASTSTEVLIRELGTIIAAVNELSGTHKLKLNGKQDLELPLFNFSTIESATANFSDANKLGQGGFGPVYKGTLDDGQEIAVKRLSRRSGQGVTEFKNEVTLISNLQHRNLVRVLGCCIKGEEKILVYEYMPNKSLDSFLFDAKKGVFLDWKKRMNIIEGIAQGLLYLHKYSRLRIIHRDLKTSNILLDSNMNPKISDFGTAKIFEENELGANTNRIVGTYGYMSPEYAMSGVFSEKSDVFSFGVMVLEILSGKKNFSFHQPNEFSNLLEYAWHLGREGRWLELMDQTVAETCTATGKFKRCIEVGLFCVQDSAEDRPTMSEVVSMLGGDSVTRPGPKQPAFSKLVKQNLAKKSEKNTVTVNGISNSTIHAR